MSAICSKDGGRVSYSDHSKVYLPKMSGTYRREVLLFLFYQNIFCAAFVLLSGSIAIHLNSSLTLYTAKKVYRKFETNIPRNETARPQSQFLHSCFCELFKYFPRLVCLFCCRKIGGPIVGIYKSFKVSFLGLQCTVLESVFKSILLS